MGNVVAFVLAVVAVLAIVLGVWWLFWLLYTWVMPQVWPSGPEAIIDPGYWLFVGMLLILSLIGSVLFNKGSEK